jgi:GT2 family glycosyltransferase
VGLDTRGSATAVRTDALVATPGSGQWRDRRPVLVSDHEHLIGERVRVDGKFFAAGPKRFAFRGVTYGTFAPRGDGAQFPETERVVDDFLRMRAAGFTVVRTYRVPPEDVVAAAERAGLRILTDVFYPDWRYLVGRSRREIRRVLREARAEVRSTARRFAGDPRIVALSLGNEVPADVLRWNGVRVVADAIRELASVVRDEDPGRLVTYANYPTAEYLPLESLDFLTFNVFLEQRSDFRRYLTRLHHLAGDRPLVLGELGISAGGSASGERAQAAILDWQLETAIERGIAGTCVFSWTDEWWVGGAPVEGWQFGLTRSDRSQRPALAAASKWNRRDVRDLDFPWPSISVVICAHDAADTIEESIAHASALDYPLLDVVVVDDGSTDETAAIVARYPWVRLVQIPHSGLAVARNEGFRAASGELIAYLDSDAYPAPEWPYYLALGLDAPNVGGVGGPNLPPTCDPLAAHVVARSPGGPVHVLLSDDRAEHVPGCNMAFWKGVLEEVGGFDPAYWVAGDDVDVCWKLLDRQWQIGFHPAAMVWHHRRAGLRPYLRQQYAYGRSEALVEARHPNRFTLTGAARWRGRIYNPMAAPSARQRVYRGPFGAAAYQSVYQAVGDFWSTAHQIGAPLAALGLAAAPLELVSRWLLLPSAAAFAALAALLVVDVVRAPVWHAPVPLGARLRRLDIALHHLLQPIARTCGRWRHRADSRAVGVGAALPDGARRLRGGVVVVAEDRPRAELAIALVDALRRRGARIVTPSGWEDHDARLSLCAFLFGELRTSSHPPGYVQIHVRPRARWGRVLGTAVLAALAGAVAPPVAAGALALVAGLVTRGVVRARRLPAKLLGATEAP